MEVGSLVECISEFDDIEFESTPIIGNVYTIREIIGGRWPYITLQEIINPITEYDNGDKGEA